MKVLTKKRKVIDIRFNDFCRELGIDPRNVIVKNLHVTWREGSIDEIMELSEAVKISRFIGSKNLILFHGNIYTIEHKDFWYVKNNNGTDGYCFVSCTKEEAERWVMEHQSVSMPPIGGWR